MKSKITYNDIKQWIERFQNTKELIHKYGLRGECFDSRSIEWAMDDALYLVALIESFMTLEEPDGVLDRAKELQGRN